MKLITRPKEENHIDYIKSVREHAESHKLMHWVKLADMKNHLAQTETLTDKLKEKYLAAMPTYGTILLDNNIDDRLIMEQMGHTDIACAENHYHRNRRSIDKKADVISSILEFCSPLPRLIGSQSKPIKLESRRLDFMRKNQWR